MASIKEQLIDLLERKEKEKKLKKDCYNLNDEELDLVCQLVQTYMDKKFKK